MSDYTRETLEDIRVEVLTGMSVNDCTKDGVALSDGQRLDCCSIVWARRLRRDSELKPIAPAGFS